MKNFSKLFLIGCLVVLFSCSEQQGRRPVTVTSGSFMKESIKRNKKLNLSEEDVFDSIMKSNPAITYISSKKGYWYYYEKRNMLDTISPKKGDVAYFDYNISDIYGNIIYNETELQAQSYRVDKENIMMGLRDGIKRMRRKEKVVFLFPSVLGFGYYGDKEKIGPNVPIICTVTLNDFKKEDVSAQKISPTSIEKPMIVPLGNRVEPQLEITPE